MERVTRHRLPGRGGCVLGGLVPTQVAVGSAHELVAPVTRHSVERLGLLEGDELTVGVEATEVMLGKERS